MRLARRLTTSLILLTMLAVALFVAVPVTYAAGQPLAQLGSNVVKQLNETAQTADLTDSGKPAAGPAEMVGNIVRPVIGLVGVIFMLLMIYSGFLYMTSAGNEKKVEQAKKIITGAAIGAVLLFSAYAITDFVLKEIDKSTRIGDGDITIQEWPE